MKKTKKKNEHARSKSWMFALRMPTQCFTKKCKYAIVFVQKTDKLQEGHEYLKKHTDYYDVWSQENLDDVAIINHSNFSDKNLINVLAV